MSENITKYKLLIASPSDLKDERSAIDDVIQELNLTYGNRNGLVIEAVKWETHTAPAIGLTKSTQDIVDNDLGDDYDLFIGMLWKKFGTPTENYGSGTEQEFRRALERFQNYPNSLQILFYFKMAGTLSISPSDLDPRELIKILDFKDDLGKNNVYYFEYSAIEDFQKFLRIHIPTRIDSLKSLAHSTSVTKSTEPLELHIIETDDLGVMDYVDIIEESTQYSTEALLQIVDATQWIGEQIVKKTAELERLKSKSLQINQKTLRDFFQRTASLLDAFVSRVQPEIPIFKDNFDKTADAISKLTLIYKDTTPVIWDDQIKEARNAVISLIADMDSGINGMSSFLSAIVAFPRIEKEMNRARRNVEDTLGEFIQSLEVSRVVSSELKNNLI